MFLKLAMESHFRKVAGLKVCKFVKKNVEHRCFPVKFAKFLRTPIAAASRARHRS